MRLIWLAFLAVSLAGCGLPPQQWEKPGVDRDTARQDLAACRRAAANEVSRNFPDLAMTRQPLSGPYAAYGRGDPLAGRRDYERSHDQMRITTGCMRNKGYELNVSPTSIIPTSPPRST